MRRATPSESGSKVTFPVAAADWAITARFGKAERRALALPLEESQASAPENSGREAPR